VLALKHGMRLMSGPNFTFDSTWDENKVYVWVSKMDTQIHLNEKANGEAFNKEQKILLAIAHLVMHHKNDISSAYLPTVISDYNGDSYGIRGLVRIDCFCIQFT
jgi:hypothetical protein